MAEEQLLYRFRKLKHIFEYKELEKQEIYFASPEELNDPMEYYKHIIFQGDNVLWQNFFKHYLMCLSKTILKYEIIKNNDYSLYKLTQNDINSNTEHIILEPFNHLFNNIYSRFREEFTNHINNLFTEQDIITINELRLYLIRLTYNIIAFITFTIHSKSSDIKILIDSINKAFEYVKNLKYKLSNLEDSEKNKCIFTTLYTLMYYTLTDDTLYEFPIYQYFYSNFVNDYLINISELIGIKKYNASFCGGYSDMKMWGHYAEGHTGICIIFNTKKNKFLFNNNELIDVKKIIYKDDIEHINFFHNIYRYDNEWNDMWYIDKYTSNTSNAYKIELENLKNKNGNYDTKIYKTKDWEYEDEYRMTTDNEKKKIKKYNFNMINGLIFGTRTPLEYKIQIIDIIKNKCKENKRKSFNLYDSYIDYKNNKIKIQRIDILDKYI